MQLSRMHLFIPSELAAGCDFNTDQCTFMTWTDSDYFHWTRVSRDLIFATLESVAGRDGELYSRTNFSIPRVLRLWRSM